MPFDPAVETPLPLAQAVALPWLPRRRHGKKLHVSTLFRWMQDGVRGVRLEGLRFGGTICTSEEALKRFLERLTSDDPLCSAPSPTRTRSPAAAKHGRAKAKKALAAAGV